MPANPGRIIAVLIGLLGLLLVGGIGFYRNQERDLENRVERELLAMATLEAGEIATWRAERLAEAAELLERPLLSSRMAAWLASPGNDPSDIRAEFAALLRHGGYRTIGLVDPTGSILLSEPPGLAKLGCDVRETLAVCLAERRPVMSDLHVDAGGDDPHVAVVAPVQAAGRDVGCLVLLTDARDTLYPILTRARTANRTAETVLVERDGDDVLYLNELRHLGALPLTLRFPADQTDYMAARALAGEQGLIAGRDYRGVDVVAVARAITGSPWHVVAKIDRAEYTSRWRDRAAVILALILAAAVAIGIGGLAAWQREQRRYLNSVIAYEKARRRSEERHRTTLQSIGDGVIATDAAGRVTMMNPVAEALTGWPAAEAQGRPLAEVFRIINEDTRATVESPADRVLREGVVVGLANHTLLIARDGRECPIADSGAPIRDEDGVIEGVVLVFRDQTDDRAIQSALERSEALYHSTMTALGEGILVFDAAGEVLLCNPAGERILGLTLAQLRARAGGLSVWQPLRPDGSDFAVEELPVARTLATGRSCRDVELGNRQPDGRVVWLQVNAEPILDPETGRARAAVVTFADITTRKAAQDALQESEARFRTAVESAPYGIFIQLGGRFAYANAVALAMFGASRPEDLLGTPVLDRFHPDEHAKVRARIARLNEAREHVEAAEEVAIRCDGSPTVLELSGAPFVLGGEKGAVVFGRDVSERKELEAERAKLQNDLLQAQKMESVGRLAGGVAHDFNNMLGVILGHCELALMSLRPDDAISLPHLEAIQGAASRSADLTRQLLAFARKQTIAPRVIDLPACIAGILEMLRRMIGEDISLVWHPETDTWPVLVDPGQIDQVVTNLVVNARDAIDGVGAITIETGNVAFDDDYCAHHPGYAPGAYVMLAISDDGAGMDAETRNHLFEPFFTTKSLGRGTGLGLATVYGIVKQNRGFINVYSEPGRGTTFRIYLPRCDRPSGPDAAARQATTPRGQGQTILLVEDEPAVLDMGRTLLAELGYDVLAAATPDAALASAREHPGEIHLLVTDVVMPDCNGRVLAARLLEVRPGLRCLFMSGYTPNAVAHRGVLDQGVHFLSKPFSRHELAVKVHDALAGLPGLPPPSGSLAKS